MKNNLLKTVAVIAIAVAMLATTVTSFAATATTVTTYNEETERLHVKSIVSDVKAGVMVTYLATKEGKVSTKDDIVYIGQETAEEGKQIVFSYDAPSAAITSAKILYGSDNSGVDAELKDNTNREVSVAGVTVNGLPEDATITITDSENNTLGGDAMLGNNEIGSLSIKLPDFYELKSVTVGTESYDVTTNAFPVKGGSEVVVECVYIATSEVALDSAKHYFVQEFGEGGVPLNTVGLVCKINGTGSYTYGVYAEKDGEPFELDATQETTNGFYPATVNGEYYAVQLASEDDLSNVILKPYYNDGKENIICE